MKAKDVVVAQHWTTASYLAPPYITYRPAHNTGTLAVMDEKQNTSLISLVYFDEIALAERLALAVRLNPSLRLEV